MVLLIGGGGLGGLAIGSTFGFVAFTIHADGVWEAVNPSQVSWTSSNPSVARIINQFGTFQAMSLGTATITGSIGAFSASSVPMTVVEFPPQYPYFQIFPFGSPIEPDTSRDARALFTVSATEFSNVTGEATWTSSNPAVATVSSGHVTGVSQGTTEITATYKGFVASYRFSVTEGVDGITVQGSVSPGSIVSGSTVSWSQPLFLRLSTGASGTFFFAFVDQNNRVLGPNPFRSVRVVKPGMSATLDATVTVPPGVTQVCSQVMLVIDGGPTRTFPGTCKDVR